jgi:hypothetical protein
MKFEVKKMTVLVLALIGANVNLAYAEDSFVDTREYCVNVIGTHEMAEAHAALQRASWPAQGFNAAVNGIGSTNVVKGTAEMARAHAALQRESWPSHGFNAAVNGIGSNRVVRSTPEMQAAHSAIQANTGGRGWNAALDGIGCRH